MSHMYPSPEEPDYAVFVRQLEHALAARGHEIERAVFTRREPGGKSKYVRLAGRTLAAAQRFRPDVVYAHFLVPTGLIAAVATRAPLVVTAHGHDVANIDAIRGVRAATRLVVERASAIVAVSDYLRRELEAKLPSARGKTEGIDSGVDLERFRHRDRDEAQRELGWDGDPAFVCVGSLIERKNVVRLADAFGHVGGGRLAFVGDGPLRPRLEGRDGVHVTGRVPHEQVARWIAAADVVCQPSLVEPFGQALLEAMACERSVVATTIGGPPEFVVPDAGVLVDPHDEAALADALRSAAALPRPNPAARRAAATHDVKQQAARVEEVLERATRPRIARQQR